MAEVEIGLGKSGRRAYGFDDIAIVPSRRTRDPEDVSIAWEIDAYRFELPLVASAMDGVVSPTTAIEIGRLGGLGVLNLEGLWTRYDDPEPVLDEIAGLPEDAATARMQEIYAEPIKPDLITARVKQIRDAGVTVAASLTPQRTVQFAQTASPTIVNSFAFADSSKKAYGRFTGGFSAAVFESVRLDVGGSATFGKNQGNETSANLGFSVGF